MILHIHNLTCGKHILAYGVLCSAFETYPGNYRNDKWYKIEITRIFTPHKEATH